MKNKMRNLFLFAGCFFVATLCQAQEVQTNMKKLYMSALMSPSGSGKHLLVGRIADEIRQKTNSPNADVFVEVIPVANLAKPGCKKLNTIFSMPGTLLPTNTGEKKPFSFSVALNMCPDGNPPAGSDALPAK